MNVLGNSHCFEKSLYLAIFGHVDNAVADGRTRHPVAHRASVQPNLTTVEEIAFEYAGNDFRRLGAAGPNEAEDSGDLPRKNGKGRVTHQILHGKILNAEYLLAGRPDLLIFVRAIEFVGKRTSYHCADDLVPVEGRGIIGNDMLPIPHYGNAIGNLKRLFQSVGDKDNRYTPRPQPSNQ